MKGIFITFEGVEGCGKTTQIALLKQRLQSMGRAVLTTREPGGTPTAERIRQLLLDPSATVISSTTELLLYAAARSQHVDERIRPALDQGVVVISDRFADSTTAYQGAGRSVDPVVVEDVHRIATRGTWPHLTIVLDLDAEIGLHRARQTGEPDRIEHEPIEFHRRVRDAFLDIAASDPDRVKIIDAMLTVDEIADQVLALVNPLLGNQ